MGEPGEGVSGEQRWLFWEVTLNLISGWEAGVDYYVKFTVLVSSRRFRSRGIDTQKQKRCSIICDGGCTGVNGRMEEGIIIQP